ncbi:MAG: hypothetical protein RL885_09645 [Planctomycetota bacterium]
MSLSRTESPGLGAARRGEEGVAMILVLVLIMVITAFGTVHLLSGRANHDMIRLSERSLRALQIAEKGVAHTIYSLTRDGNNPPQADFNLQGSFDGGRYNVDVLFLGANRYLVKSRGEIVSIRDQDGNPLELVRRGLEVVVGPTPSTAFSRALASHEGLTIDQGARIDSYDSKLGPYYTQANQNDMFGTYAREAGHIATTGDIVLSGTNTLLRGNANPGPAGSITVDDGAILTGTSDPLDNALDLPPPTDDEFTRVKGSNSNGSWWATPGVDYDPDTHSLTVPAGESLLLREGDYYFSSITLEPGAMIKSLGQTNIYLGGHLTAHNAQIGFGDASAQISLIAHPVELPAEGEDGYEAPRIEMTQSISLNMTLYAPEYEVTLSGNGDLFGAMVGKSIHVSGHSLHYDEALAYDGTGVQNGYAKLFWRETGQP